MNEESVKPLNERIEEYWHKIHFQVLIAICVIGIVVVLIA